MRRTQIQLPVEQAETLRRIAAEEGRSMADIIRESVAMYATKRGVRDRETMKRDAIEIAGAFRSGSRDLGARHDEYLAEDFED